MTVANHEIKARYLCFANTLAIRYGGWGDFVGATSDLEEAKKLVQAHIDADDSPLRQWWHVVDLVTLDIVDEGTSVRTEEKPK